MTPSEIRATVIGPNRLQGIVFFLQELAAQVAEANELARTKQPAKTHSHVTEHAITSPARVRSGKIFYVHRWQSLVQESMLFGFTPHEGQKQLADLEVGESTTGTMGTDDNSTISRRK